MRFGCFVFFTVIIFISASLPGLAVAGCDTLVPLPANFTNQTPPASLGGTGIVTGEIWDWPSNCPWILPISVALVNVTGFTIIDHGYGGVEGVIGVYDGPYSCSPTHSYVINYVNVTGTGNATYKVVAYYKIPDSGGVTLIGSTPGFNIESLGETVTHDIIMFFNYSDCANPTPTPTTTTTSTTTTTTNTTTEVTNTTMPTYFTTTTLTDTTHTMTPYPTKTTATSPTTTAHTTTTTPWPGLGIAVLIMLAYAAVMLKRGS